MTKLKKNLVFNFSVCIKRNSAVAESRNCPSGLVICKVLCLCFFFPLYFTLQYRLCAASKASRQLKRIFG